MEELTRHLKTLALSGIAFVAATCGGRATKTRTPQPHEASQSSAADPSSRCVRPEVAAAIEVTQDPIEGRVVVFEVPSGRVAWTGPAGAQVERPAWSPDGSMLAFAGADAVYVYEPKKGARAVLPLKEADVVAELSFSPDGSWLAVTGATGVTFVRPGAPDSKRPRAATLDCQPTGALWKPSGETLVALCPDQSPNLFEVEPSGAVRGRHTSFDVEELLGWRGSPAGLLVSARGGPAVLASLDDDDIRGALRPTSDSAQLASYIAQSDLFVYVDAAEDAGYEQACWLAVAGREPPWPWLRGYLKDFAFSRDGSWALFVTPRDPYDDWGDVYLVEVGEHNPTRVLEAPRFDAEAAPENDDDADYVGYVLPTPQPRAARCRAPSLRPAYALAEENRVDFGDSDGQLLPGGVVLVADENDRLSIRTQAGARSIDLDPERFAAIDAVLGLGNGNLLITMPPAEVVVLDPEGVLRWERKVPALEGVEPFVDGGIALWDTGGAISFVDADGKDRGSFRVTAGIREVWARGDYLLVVDDDSNAIALDARGRELARVALDIEEPLPPAVLRGGIAYVSYRDDGVAIVFADRAGKTIGEHLVGDVGEASLVAISEDRVVAVLREGGPGLLFFDERGKLLATNPLAALGEVGDPVAFDDGALVIVSGERNVYLIGSDGRYLGGAVLDSAIIGGPQIAGPNSVAVTTEEAVVFLERRPR